MKILKLFIFLSLFLFASKLVYAVDCTITSPRSFTDVYRPAKLEKFIFEVVDLPNDLFDVYLKHKTDGTLNFNQLFTVVNGKIHYEINLLPGSKAGDYQVFIKNKTSGLIIKCTNNPYFCLSDNALIMQCDQRLGSTAVASGTCKTCGWCDTNSDGMLDPNLISAGGEKPDYWKVCDDCITKEGLWTWTALGCVDSSPQGSVIWILKILFGIIGGLAFLLMLYGVFTVATSSGNPEKLNAGKDTIMSAIIGLILIIFCVLLFTIIGVDIIRLPDFTAI